MKAAVLTGYDKNGRMLEIRDVPMPEMKDNDVLVKIRTAGVNPLDNMIIKGEVKLIEGRRQPRLPAGFAQRRVCRTNRHVDDQAPASEGRRKKV